MKREWEGEKQGGGGDTVAWPLVGILHTGVYVFPQSLGDSGVSSGEAEASFLFIHFLLHFLDTAVTIPLGPRLAWTSFVCKKRRPRLRPP